jgi:hypothetical protein
MPILVDKYKPAVDFIIGANSRSTRDKRRRKLAIMKDRGFARHA